LSNIREVIAHYVDISGDKCVCPFHKESTPSLNIFDDTNSFYCFGCGQSGDEIEFVKEYKELGFLDAVKEVCSILNMTKEELMESKDKPEVEKVSSVVAPMDIEVVKSFIKSTGYVSHNYRGIRDEINKFYGHLTKLNSEGDVLSRYYPETNEKSQVTGYKCRNHPKDFSHGKIGSTGTKSQLSGQVKFKTGSKYVLYVGGEEDKAAAYQMLLDSVVHRLN